MATPYTQPKPEGPTATGPATATAPSFPSPASGGHAVALGVTLGAVALLLLALITYFAVRGRRARAEQAGAGASAEEKHLRAAGRASLVLDARHPASHVTPFSNHTPGANMRIARRRQDGAWVFEDPAAPFAPAGVADPSPSPLSSAASSPARSKFAEAQAERRRDTGGSLGPPPPAYHPSDASEGGYSNDQY
ncbi:hypothetical protein HWV62_25476 [Athelia sp. TMB]|nr:hypothetical protein HWV62_25476 [Athelia sp. TMB]